MWRPLLSVCPSVYNLTSATQLSVGFFLKFDIGVIYKKRKFMRKFREDSLIESHILRKPVHELLHVFYMLLYGFGCNSVRSIST